LAHPLGLIWLAGVTVYAILAKALQPRYHGYLLLAAGLFLIGVRAFLARRYPVEWNSRARYFFYNGADQLALYSPRYYLLYALFAAFFLLALAMDASSRWRESGFWASYGIPAQLYLATGMASVLLPSVVKLPQYPQPAAFLTPRLSSVSGILACWMLGAMKPRKWHAIGYTLIAAVFFTFLYVDTGTLDNIEEQVERSVAALPPGHRVVGTIQSGAESRVGIDHIVDRACVGRCFSYANYEPSGGTFRIRAAPGNSIVVAGPAAESGTRSTADAVQALDPPVFEISLCDARTVSVCVRELTADEMNDLVEDRSGPASGP
jgi:hypothetical protein